MRCGSARSRSFVETPPHLGLGVDSQQLEKLSGVGRSPRMVWIAPTGTKQTFELAAISRVEGGSHGLEHKVRCLGERYQLCQGVAAADLARRVRGDGNEERPREALGIEDAGHDEALTCFDVQGGRAEKCAGQVPHGDPNVYFGKENGGVEAAHDARYGE